MDLRQKAKEVLLKNHKAAGGKYIAPSWPHYRQQWLWDSSFHAIVATELGLNDLAKNELALLFDVQDERGFISHHIYHGIYELFDPEHYLWGKGRRPRGSRFVGQPVLAQAMEAVDDDDFTKKYAPQLVKFYKYFQEYRDAENIVSIISPTESGRDTAPEFDFFGIEKRPKWLKFLDSTILPRRLLWLESRYLLMGWDEKKILKSKLFNVKDVATHCIWIDGLYSLKRLLTKTHQQELFSDIDSVIQKAVDALVENAWDPQTRAFYPIRVGHGPIKELAIGSLLPLLVKNLPTDMVNSIIEHLKNPKKFWTPYPVPSVSLNSPKFDAQRAHPIWRGPTWLNTNWFLIRGLIQHGHMDIARYIANRSIKMVQKEGFYEFYNPMTGEGLRELTKDFSWTTLVITFPKLIQESDKHI